MLGNHMLKSWSNTQKVIALSSGEAEYYGMATGIAQAMGMKAICADAGLGNMQIKASTDSTAAKGIVSRKGMGKNKTY